MMTERNLNRPDQNQQRQENWREYLKILHISAILFLIVLFVLLIFFAIKAPTPLKSSDIKSAFFDPETVYYLKSTLEDGLREHIVQLIKTLKIDKKSIKKESDLGLDLNKISQGREADPRYFFYKADEKTIYTFIKSGEKKKPAPQRITVSILSGRDPTSNPWGIYHLEKKLMEGSTEKFLYTLEYKEGKYKRGIGKLTGHDLKEDIVKKFADGVQTTIYKYPRDTQKIGENLDFSFTLSRKNKKDDYVNVEIKDKDKNYFTFFLKPTKKSIKLRYSDLNATHEVIDTFEIDEDRKKFLENELIVAFNNLFSPENAEIFEGQLKIYKNGQDISTEPVPDESFKKLKALLENEEYNSLKGWQTIFKSSLTDINVQDFIEYIDAGQKQLNEPDYKDKRHVVYGQVIFLVIAILVVLVIYASLWYYIKFKLRSESMAEVKRRMNEKYEAHKTLESLEEADHDAYDGKPIERTASKIVITPVTKIEVREKDIDEAEAEVGVAEKPKEAELLKEESIPLAGESKPTPGPTTTIDPQVLTGIQKEIKGLKDEVILAVKQKFDQLHREYKEISEDLKNSAASEAKASPNEEFVEKILNSNRENNRLLKQVNEDIGTIIKDAKDNEVSLHDLLGYIQQETNLPVNKNNVLKLIDKVRAETRISKEYRICTLNLHDDLLELEKKYRDAWYWQLVTDGFLDELKENINLFSLRNEEAKTIYDRYFNREIPLRRIDREEIKKTITHLHWFKFWNGLIRTGDFFNAYFDDEMSDIQSVLGYYTQKITQLLKKLGFEIKRVKPLTLIPNDYRQQNHIEPPDKSYLENVILKNLAKQGNKKLQEAAANIPGGHEMVIYVERLGLVDKLAEEPVNISNLRLGAYNRTILETYAAKKEKP